MTAATLTLTEFLLARIAEDEAAAQSALALHGSGTTWPLGHPLDPVRVLAECEAKRRIVRRCQAYGGAGIQLRDDVLRMLALPYADNFAYRDEWKP